MLKTLNGDVPEGKEIRIDGDLCPFCRKNFDELLVKYDGDWTQGHGPRRGARG